MTNVLVCVKRVPDPTGEVVLTPDGMRVDGRYAGYTTSAHEECAVALAVQVAEVSGGTVTVLSVGSDDSLEQVRAGIAAGDNREPRSAGRQAKNPCPGERCGMMLFEQGMGDAVDRRDFGVSGRHHRHAAQVASADLDAAEEAIAIGQLRDQLAKGIVA